MHCIFLPYFVVVVVVIVVVVIIFVVVVIFESLLREVKKRGKVCGNTVRIVSLAIVLIFLAFAHMLLAPMDGACPQ